MKDPENNSRADMPISKDNPLRVVADHAEEGQAVVYDTEAIIRMVLKEDAQRGFELIFRRYYGPLCNHAARFVYSREVAEDLVSEVFLNCWKKRLFAEVGSTFRAYLYTAVRNSAYNYLKMEFQDRPSAREEVLAEGWADATDPQHILLLNELSDKIEETIRQFPPQCQKVFLLSRFEGKKNREIAAELQIKIKTVEAHMMKALAILKKTLAGYLR